MSTVCFPKTGLVLQDTIYDYIILKAHCWIKWVEPGTEAYYDDDMLQNWTLLWFDYGMTQFENWK